MRTIRYKDRGPAVVDVQKRLRLLNYDLIVDGRFLEHTRAAVRDFRSREGLDAGDTVDAEVWSALVDATFALGDRVLYLRMPYFHGNDVHELQEILNVLGFGTGGSDGIFGARTEHALRDFQASVALIDDGVAGPTTYEAIERLRHAWEGKHSVSNDTDMHSGFARAAEALETMEVCFFGLDEDGCAVATRAANLAQATTPFSRVSSADTLSVAPPVTTLMVGLGYEAALDNIKGPSVAFVEDGTLATRLTTAISVIEGTPRRVFIELDDAKRKQYADMPDERWHQHMAVSLLDALCDAMR